MATELASSLTATPEERLAQAEGAVRSYCEWHIAPARTETLAVTGSGSVVQPLPTLHIEDLTEVRVDGEALAATDYSWSTAGVLTRKSGGYWTGRVEVDLTHGFAEVPPEITGVVQAIASRAGGTGVLVRKQSGPFSEQYSDSSDSEREILDRYRIPLGP